MKLELSAVGLMLVVATLAPAGAQQTEAGTAPPELEPEAAEESAEAEVVEEGSAEAIARWTTDPQYLPESVASLPDSPSVPSPSEILGHVAGAPDELSSVAQVHDYFRGLAAASDRIEVEVLGTSEEGREILLARVSSVANLERLDRLREITARLADPRQTRKEEMEGLVAEGVPFYHLMGGLHSAETGSPEMLMELAYRLVVSERPEVRHIREKLVVLITPVVEPDGRDRQVEWYYRHLKGRELSYEQLREFATPPFWGHYVYHDNNRDGMQLTQALSRAIAAAYWDHHPQVLHDLHESVPLIHLSTGHGPYSLAVDPLTISEWTQFSYNETAALQAQGLPGVWTWGFWDGWWPGYLMSVANNHHSIGRFYETFGNSLPGTYERELDEQRYVGKPVVERQWYRPWPPDEKVTWSLRNNVNYMQAAVLEALSYAATHGSRLLRSFWVKGERAWQRGRDEPPHAWVFEGDQRDVRRLDYLINRLLDHRIEVHRLTEDLALGEESFAAGSFVVRLDQPYGPAARNFLDEQKFPADEPNPPYDDVAWTWPLLYGVEGHEIERAEILEAPMEEVLEPISTAGRVEGFGELYLLADRGQNALLAASVVLGAHRIDAAEAPFRAGGRGYPPGSWIVHAPHEEVEAVARRFGLDFQAGSEVPNVPVHPLDLPRLAVFHSWTSTQDGGWVRYTLDQEEVPYTLISPDDVRRGGLGRRFDVIVVANLRGNLARMVHGIDPAYSPLAYSRDDRFPSHGRPISSPDITGGMGFSGLLNLQEFVEQGGVLVTLANAGVLAVDGGLARRVQTVPRQRYNSPGSELQARVVAPEHPLTYGFEEITSVFRGNTPLFDVRRRDRDRVVLQFGAELEDEGDADGEEADAEEAEAATGEATASEPEGSGEFAPGPLGGGLVEEEELAEAVAVEDLEVEGEAAPEARPREGLVLSGYVRGEEVIAGKPAILDLPVGDGRIVIFAFNPLHRYLNHSDFRWLYNLILNWNDLPYE